jgi:hypothetical protein
LKGRMFLTKAWIREERVSFLFARDRNMPALHRQRTSKCMHKMQQAVYSGSKVLMCFRKAGNVKDAQGKADIHDELKGTSQKRTIDTTIVRYTRKFHQ